MKRDKVISEKEADRILKEANRLELNMTDGEKLAVINEITGKKYNLIDHSEE
jgi:hypothetical protein